MRAVVFCTGIFLLICFVSWLIGPATSAQDFFDLLLSRRSFEDFWRQNSFLLELRGVHIVLAAGVGFALSVAGRAMQLYMRNPLADPHIVGFSAGGTVAILLAALFFPKVISYYFFESIPASWLVSLLGAIFTLSAAYAFFLGAASRAWGIASLALIGLMINAGCAAFLMVLFAKLSPTELSLVQGWTLGSIQPHPLLAALFLLLPMLAASVVLLRLDEQLRILSFGPEYAVSRGVDVSRVRRRLLVSLMVLSATTVCAAGSVGFVGLLLPHLSRRLFSAPRHARVRPWLNGVLGAVLLVLADLAARTLTSPLELPLGVYTAVFATPALFFFLVRRDEVRA